MLFYFSGQFSRTRTSFGSRTPATGCTWRSTPPATALHKAVERSGAGLGRVGLGWAWAGLALAMGLGARTPLAATWNLPEPVSAAWRGGAALCASRAHTSVYGASHPGRADCARSRHVVQYSRGDSGLPELPAAATGNSVGGIFRVTFQLNVDIFPMGRLACGPLVARSAPSAIRKP